MEPPGKSPAPDPALYGRVAGLGAQIGCSTLMIVLAAVFGGIFLDRILKTEGTIVVIFVLGSAPLALALTYWLAMRTVKNLPTQPPGARTTSRPRGFNDNDEEGGDDR